jgi:hypothetical protein
LGWAYFLAGYHVCVISDLETIYNLSEFLPFNKTEQIGVDQGSFAMIIRTEGEFVAKEQLPHLHRSGAFIHVHPTTELDLIVLDVPVPCMEEIRNSVKEHYPTVHCIEIHRTRLSVAQLNK